MTCNEKGIFSTTGDNQLSVWTEKFQSASQSHTCTKKSHGHCLVICCPFDPYSFLNPSKTITSEKYAQQIHKMYWKLQHLWLTLGNRKNSILPHNNTWPHVALPKLQKLNKLSYEVLPHLPYSPDLSSTNYNFKHQDSFFAGKILLQPETGRKCFPRVHWILKNEFILCYRNKPTYFSFAKLCWF